MRCPQCNTELPAESEFCHQCGTRVRATCERCGALTSAGSRFCHRCGAELAQVDTGPASQTSAESARGRAASALATGCPRCRTINEPGSAYCYKCGLPFEGTRVQRVPSPAGSQAYAGEPAGFWIRFAAYLLDSVVLLVVTIIIGVIVFTGLPARPRTANSACPTTLGMSSESHTSLFSWLCGGPRQASDC